MRLLPLFALALAGAAEEDGWYCPRHCHCLPDAERAGFYKLTCSRPIADPDSLFDVNATRVSAIRASCPPGAQDSHLAPGTFARFTALRHLQLSGCRLEEAALPAGLFSGLGQLLSLRLETIRGPLNAGLRLDSGLFGALEKLESLTISDCGISALPGGALCHLKELKQLNLSRNALDSLSGTGLVGAADCVSQILVLDLSANRVGQIAGGELHNFPLLNVAHLQGNAIRRLAEGAFTDAAALRSLFLQDNAVEEVAELPPALSVLDLSANRLRLIPAAVAQGPSLLRLNLSHNLIDATTPFLLAAPRLEELDLSANDFESLPAAFFANASVLHRLHLQGNRITELEAGLFVGISSLALLDLSNNSLTKLSAAPFGEASPVKTLRLGNNSISTVEPAVFASLAKLHHLELQGNLLLDVPTALPKLYHLKGLDLSANRISSVTKFLFDKLTNLVELRLRGNRLAALERYTFEDMASLERLDLSHNLIETLEPLCLDWNRALRHLRLDSNLIRRMEDVFQELTALRSLNLSNNAITFMDFAMLPSSLRRLHLRDNDLSSLTNIASPSPRLQLQFMDLSRNNLSFINNYSIPFSLKAANLSDNAIETLEAGALGGKLTLEWLDLRRNRLRLLSPAALRIETGDAESGAVLWLSGNPLACSCDMDWMKRKMEAGQAVRMPPIADYTDLVCTQPHSAKPARLAALAPAQLLCPYRQICSADCLCCDFDSCDCKNLCPAACACFHDSSYRENIVQCSGGATAPVHPKAIPMYASQIYLDGGRMPRIDRNAFLGRFRLRHLYLNASGVRAIDKSAFNGLSALELLDLSDNELGELRGDEFKGLPKLRHLFLNGNAIKSLAPGALAQLPALTSLTLHDNALRLLPEALLSRSNLYAVTLGANPFRCDCGDRFAIQTWLPKHVDVVKDSDAVYCAQEVLKESDNLTAQNASDSTVLSRFPPGEDGLIKVNFWTLQKEMGKSLCGQGGAFVSVNGADSVRPFGLPLQYLILIGVIALIVLGGAAIAVLVTAANWRRSHKGQGAARIRKGPPSVNSSSGTTTTPVPLISSDAFVSYSAADSDWVVRELVERLEGEPPFHQLCLLHRDLSTPISAFNHYHLVNDDISDAMRRSAVLLIVVSPAFLASEWGQSQIRISHLCHLKNKASRVIFIFLGLGGGDLGDVDPELGVYIRTSTFLFAGEPLFWEKLREELPCRGGDSLPSDSDYSHLYNYGPVVQSNFV